MLAIRKHAKTKCLLSILAILGYTYGIDGYGIHSPFLAHILYGFGHANIFHLTCNLLVLWAIRNNIRVLPAFIISVLASYIPQMVDGNTVGLSGFLFASFGLMWGKTGMVALSAKTVLPFIVLTIILPQTNGTLHLYCFVLGFLLEYLYTRIKTRSRASSR